MPKIVVGLNAFFYTPTPCVCLTFAIYMKEYLRLKITFQIKISLCNLKPESIANPYTQWCFLPDLPFSCKVSAAFPQLLQQCIELSFPLGS